MTTDTDKRTAHTPGPWHATTDGGGQWLIAGPESPDQGTEARFDWLASVTARVGGNVRYRNGHARTITVAEAEANARLIAAAPALLAALEAILPYTEPLIQSGDVLGIDIARIARAAIKAAKGEPA